MNAVDHANQIRRIVRQENIDVIVLSNLAAPLAFTLMNQLSSLRVGTVFDLPDYYPTSATGYILDTKSIFGKLFAGGLNLTLRYMIRHSNHVTVASYALAEYVKDAGVSNVACIPNGISENFLRLHDGSGVREKLGYSHEDFVIGYIGSVEFWLDMRSLVKAVAIARKQGAPAKLLVVGGKLQTRYSKNVLNWIIQEGLEKHMTWLNFVPHEEVPNYIAGLDVGTIPFDTLNPTAYYAAPNKMWEYLSQQKPVIAAPIPEVLRNSDSVFLASEPMEWANKLLLAAKRSQEVVGKIATGYRKALNYTWEKSVERLKSELYSLINRTQLEGSA
jgi:glycosyltransferase involved in cell wall biosynthesis